MRIILFSIFLASFPSHAQTAKAFFAGGCFWCMEPPFEKLDGVSSVISGYAGGSEKSPSYKAVASGKTSHVEAVEVTYDPKKVSYNDLLEVFWRQIDPTDKGGQFVDRGFQYSTAIFYGSAQEQQLAEKSKEKLGKSGRYKNPIKTRIVAFTTFYAAEDYHQDYYKNNPLRYRYYRYRSGRDQHLDKHWGKDRDYKLSKKDGKSTRTPSQNFEKFKKPDEATLKEKLSPMQFKVTQKDGTEPPFDNEYWNNKEAGIYVDIVSGEPLFSSTHKYESGTGWPSFFQPLESKNIVEKVDRKLFVTRTEVRSKTGDSHLGHVFPDGPQPTGLRYCINSAALRFVPLSKLEESGYGQYLSLFKEKK